jgi:hypothetical protein
MAANSRCTHIVAAMPHPKPTTNAVIPLASPLIMGALLPRACDGISMALFWELTACYSKTNSGKIFVGRCGASVERQRPTRLTSELKFSHAQCAKNANEAKAEEGASQRQHGAARQAYERAGAGIGLLVSMCWGRPRGACPR